MDNRRDFAAAFLLSAVLVVLTLGFSASINIGSFRQNYTNALMSSFSVAGDKAARTIEQALGYGKVLEDFYDIEKTLAAVMARIPMVDDVQVALPDGRIIYTYRGSTDLKMTEFERQRADQELARRRHYSYFDFEAGKYKLYLPIRGADKTTLLGRIIIVSDRSVVDDYVSRYQERITGYCTILGIGTIAALGMVLLIAWIWDRGPAATDRGRRFMTLAALAAVQIAAGVESYSLSTTAYIETAERSTEIVGSMITADIESVIWRGAPYRSLHGLDQYFNQITATVPHIRKISLDFDRTEQPSAPDPRSGLAEARDLEIRTLMAADEAGNAPMLVMVVDGATIAGQLREIALDMASLLVTSLMFMLEINGFLNSRANRRPQVTDVAAQSGPAIVSMRFMTFLMYFGAFMPTSFVPLVMSTFPMDFFGMPPMQAAAVPLSVEMLCGAVMLVVAGRLIRTTGWLPLALAGVAMGGTGMVLCAFATGPLTFVLARGLVGLGTMAGLTGINGLIDRIRSVDGHAAPDPQMFAGMYAGVNCGAVVGALLAGRVGYGPVFMAAGAVLLLVVVQVWLAVPGAFRGRPPAMAPSAAGGGRWLALAGYLLLVSIPTSACSMFLPFLFPLLASEAGASSSTIGRAFLLNGLCIVFLGPLLWKFIRNRMPPWLAVLLAGLLTAGALISFGVQSGLPMAFLAVFLIGVADSFGLVSQQRCVEVLAGPSLHDRASARAWHLNARKIGQMLGPMLFSAVAGLQLTELKLGGIDLPGFMTGFKLASVGVGLIGTGLAVMLLVFGVAALLAPRRPGMTVLATKDAR